ncbi:MAG: hypothetical protein FWG66_13205 [Spirochaetes bacterium]|nr:hypothetical protein [Spirochaetota bacterium]
MKKTLAIIATFCISAPLFALPDWLPPLNLSAGGGGLFNIHWSDARLREQFRDYTGGFMPAPPPAPEGTLLPGFPTADTLKAMSNGLFEARELTTGGGIFGFFDATFVMTSAALVFNRVQHTVAIPDHPFLPGLDGEETRTSNFTQLNLGVFLKYPFEVSPGWSVFPLLGADWQIALGSFDSSMRENFDTVRGAGGDAPSIAAFWNSMWLRLGAGVDRAISDNLFLRGELLYGVKLPSRYERRMADYWQDELRGMSNGFHARLALGYTFGKL